MPLDHDTNFLLIIIVAFIVFAVLVLTQSILHASNRPQADLIVNGKAYVEVLAGRCSL